MNDTATIDRALGATTYAEPQSEFERLLDAPVKKFSAPELLMGDSFDRIWKIAQTMAESTGAVVPKHLQGKIGDCLAVVTQAFMWGMNPFAVAQKTHVVNGALGYEAQLVNAVVQQSGAIRGHFHYEYEGTGANVKCRVGAMLRGDTALTWNEMYGADQVKTKNSPLWATNPKQQLGYLQVKNWARAFAPGAILGVYTPDELDDFVPPADEATPRRGPQRKSGQGATDAPPPPAPAPKGAAAAADPETGEVSAPAQAPAASAAKPAASSGANGGISGGEVNYIRNKLKSNNVAEDKICTRFNIAGLELLSKADFDTLKAELLAMA